MKRYRIKPVHNNAEYCWDVEEMATSLTIKSFFFNEDAKQYRKFLEGGGGFNGFTPQFVLVEAKITQPRVENLFSVEQ